MERGSGSWPKNELLLLTAPLIKSLLVTNMTSAVTLGKKKVKIQAWRKKALVCSRERESFVLWVLICFGEI